jgi:hypothetical protein
LTPSTGAEPPSIAGVSEEQVINASSGSYRSQHQVTYNGAELVYLDQVPWYGWQTKSDNNKYKTQKPNYDKKNPGVPVTATEAPVISPGDTSTNLANGYVQITTSRENSAQTLIAPGMPKSIVVSIIDKNSNPTAGGSKTYKFESSKVNFSDVSSSLDRSHSYSLKIAALNDQGSEMKSEQSDIGNLSKIIKVDIVVAQNGTSISKITFTDTGSVK